MMVKLSRLFLILLVIMVTSIALPKYYWISLEKRIVPVSVYYSPILNDFILGKHKNNKYIWQSRQGQVLSRYTADSLLPFMNYRLLAARSKFPESINGIKIELDQVRKNNLFYRIRAKDIHTPQIQLYPLFESKPPRLKLELPKSYFRISERMEFIVAATNQIDENMTQRFTRVLQKNNFHFPAKKIFGNPTTRKPFDEGYFVIDSENQIFHIKMIHGKPFCKNINSPKDLRVKAFFIKENELREFYGLLVDEQSDVYLVMYDQYRLQKLPITAYNADEDNFYMKGNMFHRTFSIYAGDSVSAFVTNRKYELIDRYSESWPGTMDQTAGAVSRYLFPFSLELKSYTSDYVDFYFRNFSLPAYILSFILMLSLLFLKRYRRRLALKRWYDLAIVLIFGIYGYIAVLIFENTDI